MASNEDARAAREAKLDQLHVFHVLRRCHDPHGQHLTKELADFRRGGEVAFDAKRLACHVIAVLRMAQALGHKQADRDWALFLDQRMEKVGKFRHVHVMARESLGVKYLFYILNYYIDIGIGYALQLPLFF